MVVWAINAIKRAQHCPKLYFFLKILLHCLRKLEGRKVINSIFVAQTIRISDGKGKSICKISEKFL